MEMKRCKLDSNLTTGNEDTDDEDSYLYHVVVEQIDEDEEQATETIRSQITVLVEDKRAEARKMLATLGADDEDSEDSVKKSKDEKSDSEEPKKKKAKSDPKKNKSKSKKKTRRIRKSKEKR